MRESINSRVVSVSMLKSIRYVDWGGIVEEDGSRYKACWEMLLEDHPEWILEFLEVPRTDSTVVCLLSIRPHPQSSAELINVMEIDKEYIEKDDSSCHRLKWTGPGLNGKERST